MNKIGFNQENNDDEKQPTLTELLELSKITDKNLVVEFHPSGKISRFSVYLNEARENKE